MPKTSEQSVVAKQIVITRSKLYQQVGLSHPGPAWTYLYTVKTFGFHNASGSLNEARRIAKARQLATDFPIVEEFAAKGSAA